MSFRRGDPRTCTDVCQCAFFCAAQASSSHQTSCYIPDTRSRAVSPQCVPAYVRPMRNAIRYAHTHQTTCGGVRNTGVNTWMNFLPQPCWVHTNGRSPVCMRMCRSRSLRLVNLFWHSSHACGCFFPSEAGASLAGGSSFLSRIVDVEAGGCVEKSDARTLWNAVTDGSTLSGVG